MEGLKLYDKESNGTLSLGELSQVLVAMAEKLPADILEDIMKSTETKEDAEGNINYDGWHTIHFFYWKYSNLKKYFSPF